MKPKSSCSLLVILPWMATKPYHGSLDYIFNVQHCIKLARYGIKMLKRTIIRFYNCAANTT